MFVETELSRQAFFFIRGSDTIKLNVIVSCFYRIETLFKPNLMMASICQDDKYYRQLYPTIIADIEVSCDVIMRWESALMSG